MIRVFPALSLVLCALLLASPLRAAIDLYQFDNTEQQDRFHRLTEELRCPKCQNQSICLLYTSPSPRDYAASRMPSSA